MLNEEQIKELEKTASSFNVDTKEVSILDVVPNNWNPNEQSELIFSKLKGAIKKFGFLQPILVRKKGDGYEIIDGFHRYKAMMELGKKTITINCIREEVPDLAAQFLTLLANRLKGQHDVLKEAEIYKKAIEQRQSGLFELLPKTKDEIEASMRFLDAWVPGRFKGNKPEANEKDQFGTFLGKLISAENVGRDFYKKTQSEKMRAMMEAFFEMMAEFKEAAKE